MHIQVGSLARHPEAQVHSRGVRASEEVKMLGPLLLLLFFCRETEGTLPFEIVKMGIRDLIP